MERGVASLLVGAVAVAQVAPVAADDAPIASEPAPAPSSEPVPLVPTNERLVVTYRWPRWMPWTVVGGAVALGGIGLLVQHSANDLMNEYDQTIASTCAVNGCNLDNPQNPNEQQLADRLNDMRDTAERRDKIALGVMVGATAALVTGVVLVVLNRPERHVLKVDLVPAPGGATATVGFRF